MFLKEKPEITAQQAYPLSKKCYTEFKGLEGQALMRIIIGIITVLFSISLAFAAQSTLSKQDVERFSKALAYVKQYAAKNVTDKELLENAISGMLQGLDPHSDYLNKDKYKQLMNSTQGEFPGLGIELTVEHGLIKVVSPIDGSPAKKAGIKAGDYIAELNGKSVRDMTLDESIKKMRGPVGSKITLTVLRKDAKKPLKITVKRQIIKVASVKSKILEDGFGYIRISNFQENTGKQVRSAMENLEDKSKGQLKGLILDLRNNPGGLLQAAVSVSDAFLHSDKIKSHNDVIVSTKGRFPGATMQAQATSGDILDGAPLIILINQGSASASEIVAGAMQDYKRAVIMGQKSFGKGSVQTILPLDDEHAVKLTTALYYTPSGRTIQAKGIKPDILVEDLKLKDNTEALILQPVNEAALKGHFKTGDTALEKAIKGNPELAKKDYQLNEALNVLKALHVANSKISRDLTSKQ